MAEAGAGRGLSRRALIVGGGALAGYALAARPVRAAAIATPSAGLDAGMVEVPVEGAPMPAYRASPEGGSDLPVVLVVHEIFGVHEYVRDVCRRLAHAGYLALAPDLYRRVGDPTKIESVQQLIRDVVAKVPDETVLSDLDAALAWSAGAGGDPERAFATGFCWGGRIVWMYAAHRKDLRAGAAWYGRLDAEERPPTPKHPLDVVAPDLPPVLGLYGSEDSGIPLEDVHAMRRKLAETAPESEILIFPGAPHGFHADYRSSYREMAAREGWDRMLAWFARHGPKGL